MNSFGHLLVLPVGYDVTAGTKFFVNYWEVKKMDNTPKLSIVMLSEDLEKLHAAALMGSVASMSGMTVNLFVTMNALEAFRKDVIDGQKFATGTIGGELIAKKVPLFYDLIKEGKDMGDLHLYGCAMAMDLMEWKQEDLIPEFDDIIGVTAFFGMAEGGQILTV
jgi:peroxiredoxin family protein